MPPAITRTAPIDAKVAKRQFLACTRALPMRASHSWRARRYGVSSGPSGIHCVVMRRFSSSPLLLRCGEPSQTPAIGCVAGAGPGAGLPIEERTSDASAPAGVLSPGPAAPPDPLDARSPPPALLPNVEPTEALGDPAERPLRGNAAAAARVADTLEATRPATAPAAMPAAIGRGGCLKEVVGAEMWRAAEQAPGQARRLPAEKHERADGEKDRPELVERDLGSREMDAR